MEYQRVKANLNLYAVLRNLETLVACDGKAAAMIKGWEVTLEFSVFRGPTLYLEFENGRCRAGEGAHPAPDVRLFFLSAGHLNRMMDGKGSPIPLKGLTRLSFLTKEFPKLTDRLEYFLKPDDTLLADTAYKEVNTRLNLGVAAYAVRELATSDPMGALNAASMPDGTLAIRVLPDGPSVSIVKEKGRYAVGSPHPDNPMAVMSFRDMGVACDLMNGKCDAFAALAKGDVSMKGSIPMIEATNLLMDRIPHYLG
ncbi:hypothetical protein [Desulfoluna spongiiphila]|uniref:SCP-2 sterol transfer family protein n=1 Tax=Desulfoluna spongiiphila TaxID=419481 RepID=A0A1G5IJE3_9BACT|nr:hypothetical protein [Desulfoluna spongiiphila]SCY75861.1 hypothetical protein SAMN05216233_12044 [Desulfoluna spongiiphila]VVS90913.1 scp2 sterol-binding domain superfamily [Desulfoluna spongiiphila]